jgi:multidrug resistance efflux pump
MDEKQDITILDDEAHRMRVSWDKAMNFIANFNHAYRENERKIASGNFGWSFNSWLLAKVGVPEETALKVMETVARYARLGEQERDRERLLAIKREKEAGRARLKAEQAAEKQRKAEARAAQRSAKRPVESNSGQTKRSYRDNA